LDVKGSRAKVLLALSAVLVLAACGSGDRPKGNLTDAEWERMVEFADDAEADGFLRPVLPAYLPDGFDTTPHIFEGGTKEGRTIVLFWPDDSSLGANLRPGELQIIRWDSDADHEPSPCDDSDENSECVEVQGREARLETSTRLADEDIAWHVEFVWEDSPIWVDGDWVVDKGTKHLFEESLRNEVLRIAESVAVP
jgi:hypothetical protein